MIERSIPSLDYVDAETFRALGFVQSVRWNGMVHYAGIVPFRGGMASGLRLVGEGDMAAQLAFMLEVLDACLAADGGSRANLLSWTLYTTDMDAFMAIAPMLAEWVGDHPPASTTVGVSRLALPGQMLELTAIAGM